MATTLDQLRKQRDDFPAKLEAVEESYDVARRAHDKREDELDEAGRLIEKARTLAESDLPAAEAALRDADRML
jgi:hypothetical protein